MCNHISPLPFLFPNAPTSPPLNPAHAFRFMNTYSVQQSMELLYNRSHLGTHTQIFLHFLKDLFPLLVLGENLAAIYFIHLIIHISSLKIERLFFLCLDNYRHAYDMPRMGLFIIFGTY